MRKILSAIVMCFITGVFGMFSPSACSDFWETEIYTTVDGMDYRRLYPDDEQDYYASSSFIDLTGREVYFIARNVKGYSVKVLGVVPFMSSYANPIVSSNYPRVNNVYCPGCIERCEDGYFRTYYADDAENPFHIFYCGAVIDLSEAGYGAALVYYVPSAQLEEYLALWQDDREGEIRAANVEYRLNAEGMEEYYYVDYVEAGSAIVNIPPEPTREGYEFTGWFTDESGTRAYDFERAVPSGEAPLSLFAGWEKL